MENRPKYKILKKKNVEIDFLLKNSYLNDIKGVIHVGANTGQERYFYNLFDLNVLWIEPIPEIYQRLKYNLKDFDKQICINELITDKNDKYYDFFVTNNDGLSSSLFELKLHKKIWPHVKNEKKLKLKSKKLETIFEKTNFDISNYQALVMDTQGSELMVLKGCNSIIKNFKYIKTEVSDFESYKNCCQIKEIEEFMKKNNYDQINKYSIGEKDSVGKYFDITYKRK